MTLVALMLAIDAVLHGLVVYRFGARGNEPYLVFTFVYAVLALAVFLAWPYALWAALVIAGLGLAGLTMTFGRLERDKSLDRIISAVDVLIVLCAAYLLFMG